MHTVVSGCVAGGGDCGGLGDAESGKGPGPPPSCRSGHTWPSQGMPTRAASPTFQMSVALPAYVAGSMTAEAAAAQTHTTMLMHSILSSWPRHFAHWRLPLGLTAAVKLVTSATKASFVASGLAGDRA